MNEVQAKLKALHAIRSENEYYRTKLVEARALASSLPYLAIKDDNGKERPVGARLDAQTSYSLTEAHPETRAEVRIVSPGEDYRITTSEARRIAEFLFVIADEADKFNASR